MSNSSHLNGSAELIDLEFMERKWTPYEIIKTGIQLHPAGLSFSNAKQYLVRLGIDRSQTVIHNWIQKTDLQPSNGPSLNRIAVNETAIQINSDRFWLYAAADLRTNEYLTLTYFAFKILILLLLCFV